MGSEWDMRSFVTILPFRLYTLLDHSVGILRRNVGQLKYVMYPRGENVLDRKYVITHLKELFFKIGIFAKDR